MKLKVYAAAAMKEQEVAVSGDWAGVRHSISIDAELQQGENTLSMQLEADGVDLWWPVGYGAQAMYNVTATVSGSVMSRRLGFRTYPLCGAFSGRL